MRRYGFLLAGLLLAAGASAQQVISPSAAVFQHSDADFATVITYHLDFFQCASVTVTTPPACLGKSATPFVVAGTPGVNVPKSAVTGPATARSVNFKVPPVAAFIAALPAGVAFTTEVTALVDTANNPGVTNSPASGDSNPFFSQARTLAAPSGLTVR